MTDQKYTALFLRLLITADKPAAAFQKMFFTNNALKNIYKFIAPEYKNKNASSAFFLTLEASASCLCLMLFTVLGQHFWN